MKRVSSASCMQVLVDVHDSRWQHVPWHLFRPGFKHSQKIERNKHHGLSSDLFNCVKVLMQSWSSPSIN
eukprot:5180684-Amphidinium_carterae.1